MADGIELALDVYLPDSAESQGAPTVLIQSRYWRSLQTGPRGGPAKRLPPAPREPIAEALLDAGYAVVVADVRGTGASDGSWVRPWSDAEVADEGTLVSWIAGQPWSNGRVGAYGLSYEGTTAMLTVTSGRPELRAVLVREIEWDLADELVAPGGVKNLSFIDVWGRSVAALDRDEWPELFGRSIAKNFVKGVRWTDDDLDGALQAQRVERREVADVAAAVATARAPTDPFGVGGPAVADVGPLGHLSALADTPVAVGLWGGWWDGATADAVFRADDAMPIVDARVGGWNHEGNGSASPLGSGGDGHSAVDLAEVIRFFDTHLRDDGAGAPKVRRWFVTGPEVWEEGASWPETTLTTLDLRGDGTLGAADASLDRSLDVDFAATVGPDQRWTAGLTRPVPAPDRGDAPGLISWQLPALDQPLRVFGPGVFECAVELTAPEAALHVYVEAVQPNGRVRLLTEGELRVETGPASVRLRPVAFELDAGWGLRLSVAGADADVFERVPAAGPQQIRFRASPRCALTLPTR